MGYFKKWLVGLCCLMILALALLPIFVQTAKVPTNQKNQFNLDISFDDTNQTLNVNQKLVYVNNTNMPLDNIYFHLYPNAFKDSKTSFFVENSDEFNSAYKDGFTSGFIDIKRVETDGITLTTTNELDAQVLNVKLTDTLAIGNKTIINMEYIVKIPNCYGRFGKNNVGYNLTNFYPIPCAYDENGWNLEKYHNVGDPFYSDVSDYQVTITTPPEYLLASTGDNSVETKFNMQNYKVKAQNVRDFAFVLSENFSKYVGEEDGIEIFAYSTNTKNGNNAVEMGRKAIQTFNKLFGKYPYAQFSVVETGFFIGGMEYPNLVLIDQRLYDNPLSLEYVIAHETAHQWWYGMVGNDQVDEAFVDEALTDYSTILYFGENYGQKVREYVNQQFVVDNYEIIGKQAKDEIIDKPTYTFNSNMDYSAMVYGKGCLMFQEFEKILGKENMLGVLQDYFNKYQYKNVTKNQLIDQFTQTGRISKELFEAWLGTLRR